MNAPSFFAGIVIVISGAFLLFAGPQLIMIPTTHTQVDALFNNEAFIVGDVWERQMQLDEGVLVNGTLTVGSALTGEPSEISMLIVDDANYQKWLAHGSPTYALQRGISNGQTFMLTVPHSGLYHLIFDNTDSPVKKNITMSIDLQRQVLVNLPDERIHYLAYVLLAVGFLVAVIGILRRTEVPWA